MVDWSGRRRRGWALATSLAAVLIALAHVIWPRLRIDAITVALLAIAVAPWLGGLFESIELPGGWTLRYRQLAARVDRAQREASGASQAAAVALGAATVPERSLRAASGYPGYPPPSPAEPPSPQPERLVDLQGGPSEPPPQPYGELPGNRPSSYPPPPLPPSPSQVLSELVEEYATIQSGPRGKLRTSSRNQIFGQLLALAPTIPGFDPRAAMRSPHVGWRLAGYAYVYAQPAATYAPDLVDVLAHGLEDSSFNQYWAIRALRLIVERAESGEIPARVLDQFQGFVASLGEGSDRRYEAEQVLAAMSDYSEAD